MIGFIQFRLQSGGIAQSQGQLMVVRPCLVHPSSGGMEFVVEPCCVVFVFFGEVVETCFVVGAVPQLGLGPRGGGALVVEVVEGGGGGGAVRIWDW